MKKIAFAFALFASVAAFGDMKVGLVEMLVLVRNHPSYDTNRRLLSDTEKDYQKRLDKLRTDVSDIEKEGKDIADQIRNPMLAEAAKKKLEDSMADVQNRYLQAQQKLRNEAMRSQDELQELEGRLLKATTDDLRRKIADFADRNDYDLIVDSSAVPFSRKEFDVTDAVLKSMGIEQRRAEDGNEGK